MAAEKRSQNHKILRIGRDHRDHCIQLLSEWPVQGSQPCFISAMPHPTELISDLRELMGFIEVVDVLRCY